MGIVRRISLGLSKLNRLFGDHPIGVRRKGGGRIDRDFVRDQ
jgi:hypothetical protein